jgi:hypothetical protein
MLASASSERSRLLLATSGRQMSSKGDALRLSRDKVLVNVQRKVGELPNTAFQHKSFETPDGRVRVERAETGNSDVWALRYSEPDASVPGRDWIVEAVSVGDASASFFSCRLSLFSKNQNFTFIPSTPGILKDVAATMTFYNQKHVFLSEAGTIDSAKAVDDVVAEIVSRNRWWNVIIVSESIDANFGCDAARFSRDLMGVANVFFLPVQYIESFSIAVGRDFQVYGGGVRTFRPGFDKLSSETTSHPVIRAPNKSNTWQVDRVHHVVGMDAFGASIQRTDFRHQSPGFFDVRQIAALRRLNSVKGTSESNVEVSALKEALEAAREEMSITLDLASQAEQERNEFRDELDEVRAQNYGLKSRIAALEGQISTASTHLTDSSPSTYDEIPDWVRRNLSSRLRLDPRAERSLKKAEYKDIQDVICGLKLLAYEYCDMRCGRCSKADFESALSGIGMKFSGSISKTGAGEQGEEYFIKVRGRRTLMDFHLAKGTSYEPRHSLRIYFLFDEDDREVVVGWLPSHLDNRLS